MTKTEKLEADKKQVWDKLVEAERRLDTVTRALHHAQADNAELRRLTAESAAHKAHADWLQGLTETLVRRVSVEGLEVKNPAQIGFTDTSSHSKGE